MPSTQQTSQQSHTPTLSLLLTSSHIKRSHSRSVMILLPLNRTQGGLISSFFLKGTFFSSEYTPTSLHLIGKPLNTNLSAGTQTFASLMPLTLSDATGYRAVRANVLQKKLLPTRSTAKGSTDKTEMGPLLAVAAIQPPVLSLKFSVKAKDNKQSNQRRGHYTNLSR